MSMGPSRRLSSWLALKVLIFIGIFTALLFAIYKRTWKKLKQAQKAEG